MRHQQVNLLAPMLRKPHALLSARLALRLCALLAGLLALSYAGAAWNERQTQRDEQRLQVRKAEILAALQQRAQQAAQPSQDVAAELAQLTAERDRQAAVLAALSRHALANTRGFSPQLAGLARQRLGGLWLTRIELSGGGRDIALDGAALADGLIPRYLEALGRESVFSGIRFQHAVLEGPGDSRGPLRFELRTRAAP